MTVLLFVLSYVGASWLVGQDDPRHIVAMLALAAIGWFVHTCLGIWKETRDGW